MQELSGLLQGINRDDLASALWRSVYSQDGLRYVQELVRIEDRDAAGLVVPFELWPAQAEALQAFINNRFIVVLKARQLGLTWLALAYASWLLVFRPGASVVALSKREQDAKELARRMAFIKRYLPAWLVRHQEATGWGGPTWSATALTVTVRHQGEKIVPFKA